MKHFRYDLKMSDGGIVIYTVDVPDDMTVSKITESMSKANNFFVLDYPSGQMLLINIRHIVSIKITDITDPA